MFQFSYMRQIAAILGVAGIIALGAYTYYSISQARMMNQAPVMISVSGTGEIFARPDIATFSYSVNAKADDAVTAQNESAKTANAIIAYLKEQGIEEKDIKTQMYSLNPRYEYPSTQCVGFACPPVGEPKIIGYEVTQSVSVKVRAIDTAGALISKVGELGATDVSGLSFTIDDTDVLQMEARTDAIADATEKAKAIAAELGMEVDRVTGYFEEDGGMMPFYSARSEMAMDMKAAGAVVPDIAVGENTITSRVNVSFELR
jgi:uncharacterized protein YggE